MSSSPPSWVWSTLKNFTVKNTKGGVAFRGADVARLLQHLLGEDDAESGVSLQSLRSKLSPFLDPTSQTMSITALPAVLQHLCLITLTHHQCEELLARGEACCGSSSLLEVRGACNVRDVATGAAVLLGSEKYANLSHAQLCQEVAHRDMEMIELRNRFQKGLKRARYLEVKCSDGQEALVQKGKMIGHLRSILNLREGRKNVTICGGYAMAIKRNLSHSGAAAMVATLGGEEERGGLKSKDAVIRFEHYTNLSQRHISRLYSAARRDFDESARGRSSFSNVEVKR